MNRFWQRLFCWFYGHDARVRMVNPETHVTVYECAECRKTWAEKDGLFV